MDKSPLFDHPEKFDPGRIRLADIDGSGTTDLVYIGDDQVQYWINQSGNGYSQPSSITPFPHITNLQSVNVLDFLGDGTACLVWRSSEPRDEQSAIQFLPLMRDGKPYLLKKIDNGAGSVTRIHYAPSTKFYLNDKKNGHIWPTKLPFPTQVIERTETEDLISGAKFTTRYDYHYGHYDGIEREFSGFAYVEQWDTEEYSSESMSGSAADNPSSPPIHTKTWFHLGSVMPWPSIDHELSVDFFGGDTAAWAPEGHSIPPDLTTDEYREAQRALKGQMLRQEVYSDDGSDVEALPFTIAMSSYEVSMRQPKADNRNAVFQVTPMETLTYHYERNMEYPRIAQTLVLEQDEFGNPTRSAAIAYPRRPRPDTDHPAEQTKLHITISDQSLTHDMETEDRFRHSVPIEAKAFSLENFEWLNQLQKISRDSLKSVLADGSIPIVDYHTPPISTPRLRLLSHTRNVYRDASLKPLPFSDIGPMALPFESYALAFTSTTLAQSELGARIKEDHLRQAGYRDDIFDDGWWAPSGRLLYTDELAEDLPRTADMFYMPVGAIDPFGNVSRVEYDDYLLFPQKMVDALGNETTYDYDYRLLTPWRVTDPNGNRTEFSFDIRGMVVATAVIGKNGEGDSLENPTTRFEYDLFAFQSWRESAAIGARDPTNPKPNWAKSMARETHGVPETDTRWQESIEYSDGFGRVIQAKAKAEPGDAPVYDDEGKLTLDADGRPVKTHTQSRWLGSGAVVYNNKGEPVRQYEPFFDSTSEFTSVKALTRVGVSPTLRYDPIGRVVRTDLPDGTYTKVEFTPWEQATFDPIDTIADSQWLAKRLQPDADPADRRAAEAALKHADTPSRAYLDTLGRPFVTIAHNKTRDGADEFVPNASVLDIEGNVLAIHDARGSEGLTLKEAFRHRGNAVMRYAYGMGGHQLYSLSMDAGERWGLNDVTGAPLFAWDENDRRTLDDETIFERRFYRTEFDPLRRPIAQTLSINEGPEQTINRTIYGEELDRADARERNLLGQAVYAYDQSGRLENVAFDFKGNLLKSKRRLVDDIKAPVIDWAGDAAEDQLLEEEFTKEEAFDALNRMTQLYNWRRDDARVAVYEPTYNQRGVLQSEDLTIGAARTADGHGGGVKKPALKAVDHNEKGQRTRLELGNGTVTRYDYDPLTYRLRQLRTTKPGYDPEFPSAIGDPKNENILQNLFYTYDAVGNITRIYDDAFDPTFFRNTRVDPESTYDYDALYRLIKARGRENAELTRGVREHYPPGMAPSTTTPQDDALRDYTQHYHYDVAGNILSMRHEGGEGWTRAYSYAADSNRLLETSIGRRTEETTRYRYDAHGSILNFGNADQAKDAYWDYRDMLAAADLGGGGFACYAYDAGKNRTRKRIERVGGVVEERLYLGGMEIFRRWQGETLQEEIETHHLFLDDQRVLIVEDVMKADHSGLPLAVLDRYQYSNHLGSVGLELDGDGRVISYEEYHPYGTLAFSMKSREVKAAAKRYRYTGMERDEETGLSYHTARYYLPWLGRWLSADPIGVEGGVNLYGYASTDPTDFNDLSGLQPNRVRHESTTYLTILNKDLIIDIVLAPEEYGISDPLFGVFDNPFDPLLYVTEVADEIDPIILLEMFEMKKIKTSTVILNTEEGSQENLRAAHVPLPESRDAMRQRRREAVSELTRRENERRYPEGLRGLPFSEENVLRIINFHLEQIRSENPELQGSHLLDTTLRRVYLCRELVDGCNTDRNYVAADHRLTARVGLSVIPIDSALAAVPAALFFVLYDAGKFLGITPEAGGQELSEPDLDVLMQSMAGLADILADEYSPRQRSQE